MAPITCPSCNALLHARLRARLSFLASLRSRSQVRSKYQKTAEPPKLAYHWDTVPPTAAQLESATAFVQTHPPRKLWTANEWRNQNQSDINGPGTQLIPEVAFLGRSNVGKSSLLNALLQSPELNRVGPRPGKTTTMHAWGLSASDPITGGAGPGGEMDIRLAVLDMPGYGFRSRDEWGKEIVTYLRRRKQLRRAFVLIDALHGIKSADEQMVDLLRSEGISYQIIVSKADRLLETSKIAGDRKLQAFLELVRGQIVQPLGGTGVAGLGEILAVGNLGDGGMFTAIKEKDMLGIERVRWAALVAAGLEEWATKRTGTSSDKKRWRNNLENGSTKLAEEVSASEPPREFQRPGRDYSDDTLTVPPNTERRMKNPFLSSSSPIRPIATHESSSPSSFLTPTREEKTRAGRTPFFASSDEDPSTSTTTKEAFNPVGGLAELEAQLSSPSQSPRKGKKSKRKAKPVHMSDNLRNRLNLKREKMNELEMKKAAKLMGDSSLARPMRDGSSASDTTPTTREHDRPLKGRAYNNNTLSHPIEAFTFSPASPSHPHPAMLNGKGVGGMADLLAMSSSGSSDSRGRGGKPWKEKEQKEKGGRGRGKFKRAAKARYLAKAGAVGW